MNAICVLSGGMDSTTLLYHMLEKHFEVKAISFDYGQKHKKELGFAQRTCRKLGVDHKIIDLSGIKELLEGSALTDSRVQVPESPYEESAMKSTVVANRNMIFLSVAGGWAVSQGFDLVAIAVHAGDHDIYPDCRPAFISSLEKTLELGNYHKVAVYAPYLNLSKADIVREGRVLGVDYERDTWSCYVGAEEACGTCPTCLERSAALEIIA